MEKKAKKDKKKKSNVFYAFSCLQRRKFYQTKSMGQKKKFEKAGKIFCAPSFFNITRTSFLRIMKLNFQPQKRNQQKFNFNYNLKFPKGFSFIKKKKKRRENSVLFSFALYLTMNQSDIHKFIASCSTSKTFVIDLQSLQMISMFSCFLVSNFENEWKWREKLFVIVFSVFLSCLVYVYMNAYESFHKH